MSDPKKPKVEIYGPVLGPIHEPMRHKERELRKTTPTYGGNPNWKVGMPSPNPGGMSRAQHESRRMAHELVAAETNGGAEIIKFAVEVMRGQHDICTDPASLRWAAAFLADRVWGKAPLTIAIKPAVNVTVEDTKGMSLAQLKELAGEMSEGQPEERVIDIVSEDPEDVPPGDVH